MAKAAGHNRQSALRVRLFTCSCIEMALGKPNYVPAATKIVVASSVGASNAFVMRPHSQS